MKLYLISQDYNCDYDTFDSAVVAAESPEKAVMIHPKESWGTKSSEEIWSGDTYSYKTWVSKENIDKIQVKYIGETELGRGVVLASYNAG